MDIKKNTSLALPMLELRSVQSRGMVITIAPPLPVVTIARNWLA
jgi:hypothetical protein